MSNAKHHQSSSELKEIAGVDDYDWQEASNVKASAAGTNTILMQQWLAKWCLSIFQGPVVNLI